MPILERRVQVLFDPQEYEALADLARTQNRSVGSIIRESVQRTLSRPASAREAALGRLLARAGDAPVGDWDTVKDGFERTALEAIA
ncbi:MAG: hypothetical protein FWC46_04645 [Actinomycetia bacterium]|nr:hypothetical protein [Actinomycetes bacterium]